MNILYFTTPEEDYLQDQILIGLRNLFGPSVVDFPKKEKLYKTCTIPDNKLYGHGFTIWKILDEININRDDALTKLQKSDFDAIIFGSICRQLDFFETLEKRDFFGMKNRLIFLDGEDHSMQFKPAVNLGNYFKRELLTPIPGINRISFSIPSQKIISENILSKTKKFTKHVQCEEVYKIDEINKNCTPNYAFSTEEDYYQDISESMYGFTMKKGGWDCMRHYEIAANGTVPCFYKFNDKPLFSAPHGLFDMENMISFNTAEELTNKLSIIEEKGLYKNIQSNSINWAKAHSCDKVAKYVLKESGINI